jgi:hypothetical protein
MVRGRVAPAPEGTNLPRRSPTVKGLPSLRLTPLETAEELGERFEEATEHARQHDDFAEVRLGPNLPIAMAQLKPGVLAWKRALTTGSGSAELVYVVRPKRGASGSPFTARPLNEFRLRLECQGPPAATLLLASTAGRSSTTLAAFARQVCENLETDSD